MPSYARRHQLSKSLLYHVFNRGNFRRELFHSNDDYRHFMRLLREYTARFMVKAYHWVIMVNHYHLLIEMDDPERISKLMAGLHRAYTHYYHGKYKTSGILWQGRFKLQPIQKEKHMVTCGRYIERNPVRAGLVKEAQEYEYSSARFYCQGRNDEITVESPLFAGFGSDLTQRQAAYGGFLRSFSHEEESSFAMLEHPQGDSEFVKRLIKENGRYLPRRQGRVRREIFVV